MSSKTVRLQAIVPAPPERVREALTGELEQSAIVGGRARMAVVVGGSVTWSGGLLGHVTGVFRELEPNRVSLLLDPLPQIEGWGLGPPALMSLLEIALTPGQAGAVVTLTHSCASDAQAKFLASEWRKRYLAGLEMHFERRRRVLDAVSQLELSPFAAFAWHGDDTTVMSGGGGRHFEMSRPLCLRIIHLFDRPRTRDDALAECAAPDRAATARAIDSLVGAGVVVSHGTERRHESWEPHDLLFHQISTTGAPTWSFLGRREPPPAVKAAMSDRVVPLSEPNLPAIPLGVALTERRSVREFSSSRVPLDALSTFLAVTARNVRGRRRWNHEWMPGEYVSRPYPTGGARYSLEVYLAVNNGALERVEAGLYRYCPENHHLEDLRVGKDALASLFTTMPSESLVRPLAGARSENVVAPILVAITTRFARVSYKYSGVAYSLVLRDVGTLLQNFYLVAPAVGLGGCALGGGLVGVVLPRVAGLDVRDEPVVGSYMLGVPMELMMPAGVIK